MSETWVVDEDLGDGIRQIVLSRPPVNALNADFLNAVADRVEALIADPSARAIVISSAFTTFSAGMDLKEAQGLDEEAQLGVVDGLNRCYLELFSCPKPIVSAVGGPAIAGGMFFVLTADYRVATQAAQFGLAEVRVGVDFPLAALEVARAMLSPNDLRVLLQTGQPYDIAQAQAAGIVDKVVEPDELLPTAVKTARKLARIPPTAYANVKRQMRGAVSDLIAAGLPERRGTWITAEAHGAMQRMLKGEA